MRHRSGDNTFRYQIFPRLRVSVLKTGSQNKTPDTVPMPGEESVNRIDSIGVAVALVWGSNCAY
jgi:hypothetical protein